MLDRRTLKVDYDIGFDDGREFGRGDLGGQKADDFDEEGNKKPVPVEEDAEGDGGSAFTDGGGSGENAPGGEWKVESGDGDAGWDTGAAPTDTENSVGDSAWGGAPAAQASSNDSGW